jgi:phospholipid transport system substrate-binding protein
MKYKLLLMGFIYILSSFFVCARCCAGTPTEHVRAMLDKVMSIQIDPRLKGEGFRDRRRIAIKEVIKENFDFDAMAEQTLGQFRKDLDETRRAEFRHVFQDLFQDSYTRMVLDFLKKEEIHYAKGHINPGKALVKTTIVRINDEIPVDYFLAPAKNGWLVYDVEIDGVSIVKNYKRSFARVIKKESFDALLRKMRLQQRAVNRGDSE